MRILIAEDDFTSRKLMQKYLEPLGMCDLAVNGAEAVDAFESAHFSGAPYDLICLDIMMPVMDGQQVLKRVRHFEKLQGVLPAKEVKILMTSALDSPRHVVEAFYRGGCTDYLVKPIDKETVLNKLREVTLFS